MSPPRPARRAPRAAAGFDELAQLKLALDQAQRDRLLREAEQQALAARLEHERTLFARSVGSVTPLRRPASAPQRGSQPEATARQRELDEAAVLHEAISDEFDVESLLETDETLFFRRSEIGIDVVRKLRRGAWAIQAELDLHGLRRDEAREALAGFLRLAVRRGLRCVRVVHGKGNGSPGREPVLKSRVRSWLVQRREVIAFAQARPADGGNGAVVVLLGPTTGQRLQPLPLRADD